jgi:hypothetical protein
MITSGSLTLTHESNHLAKGIILNEEVKLDKDGLPLKKYHFGDEWFEGDGPDYMGSLSYALKELYNLNVNDDLVILEESENGVTGPAEYYDENGL